MLKKKIFSVLAGIAMAFLCLSQTVQAEEAAVRETYEPELFSDFHAEDLTLYAKGAVLVDCENLRILYGKDANTPMANASTTKILTCILALERGKKNDVVTVSERACKMPKVKMGFAAGEQFYLGDLLYSLMLESHNDSAVAIAEQIGGSVEGFAKLMNEKAAELGCKNSHFVTSNGLDGTDDGGRHSTTAYDLCRIMSYCIQNPDFLTITRTASRQISNLTGTKSYSLTNHNALLQMLEGTVSGKTGFTGDAGYCYVGAYEKDGKKFAFALLACGWPNNKGYKWKDARTLIAYGNEKYEKKRFSEGKRQIAIPLREGAGVGDGISYPNLVHARTDGIAGEMLLADTDQITASVSLPKELTAPVRAGDKVGEVHLSLNGCVCASQNIYLTESAERFDRKWVFRQIVRMFFLPSPTETKGFGLEQ